MLDKTISLGRALQIALVSLLATGLYTCMVQIASITQPFLPLTQFAELAVAAHFAESGVPMPTAIHHGTGGRIPLCYPHRTINPNLKPGESCDTGFTTANMTERFRRDCPGGVFDIQAHERCNVFTMPEFMLGMHDPFGRIIRYVNDPCAAVEDARHLASPMYLTFRLSAYTAQWMREIDARFECSIPPQQRGPTSLHWHDIWREKQLSILLFRADGQLTGAVQLVPPQRDGTPPPPPPPPRERTPEEQKRQPFLYTPDPASIAAEAQRRAENRVLMFAPAGGDPAPVR